ncbi:MAG: pyrroline-5-carboxylate reductase [Chlorobium sp.]|jgi:pyrroline-5-carboxylate reductase|uniref:pyrroline-5-carboxylate reductase n=1 Tax=Chlorobium sp. TaxID=1095 RepID=UPI001DFEC72D|nr:pyrroline-5-carboxylate reductase [Chlorobium sp.]MBN1278360.1 pyrroline-5-carboxylate reductase [Chlorobiaceae bacterium]MCF8216666.1 pyrroline-5-carboxylate reductase [Chlorobium sp.]MCF8270873.1 pyrroline-5-carboxylate reductase [Chlorobium sp.]MCF8287193.1 pyrroline-5-carboxylate reductase [Chlorobium sp.]MCF8290850.1 pyrroline-5-carboxylate reductase [Chlorobium sp.]
MNTLHTGFIGTGRIARALIAGLAAKDNMRLYGFDTLPEALKNITATYPVEACSSIEALAEKTGLIVLSVKPYQMEGVLAELKAFLTDKHLLVSVAAGISSEFIRRHAGESVRVIRVMPNTPAFVGEGMTALCRGAAATDADIALAEDLFRAIGMTVVLDDEQLMDAATAVSGSGPAYMFRIIASLAEGGMLWGLSREDALLLAAQTMYGAAKMVLAGSKSPEALISEVTTPGGTTEAGLTVMQERDIRQTLIDTVSAAAERSRELKK